MRKRNETGALGGFEGLAFGVLIFVFGTLMVTTAWSLVDTKLATAASAREAARAYVEAETQQHAMDSARQIATEAMTGHGRELANISVVPTDGGAFERCSAIQITVTANVPKISLPLIGRRGGTSVVTSSHTEVVDPYRSGLAGVASC